MTDVWTVVWPVTQRAAHSITRPARFVSELMRRGALVSAVSHSWKLRSARATIGLASGDVEATVTRPSKVPGSVASSHAAGSHLMISTPVVNVGELTDLTAAWVDYYDDWSIAPEMGPATRARCRRAYASIESAHARLLSVNSRYMYRKLRNSRPVLVPNGVDPELADIARPDDDRPHLLVMGSFRRHRTDPKLVQAVIDACPAATLTIAGPGWRYLVSELTIPTRLDLELRDYADWNWVGANSGSRTVALIPSLVSDYTMSQDPIKYYYYLALGIPIIMPRLLMPVMDLDRPVYGLESWTSLEPLMIEAFRPKELGTSWRRSFASENSWASRIDTVLTRIQP